MKDLFPIFLFSLLLFSCKKEQALFQNIDCSCAKEVTADFVIEELGNGYDIDFITETDTCYDSKLIRFRALENNANYSWKIGSIPHSEQIITDYPNVTEHTLLPVTLIVTKKPNSICLPNDDGYDSVTKYLYVKGIITDVESSVMEGTYRMKDINKADSIDITLDYRENTLITNGGAFQLDIYNYDGNGSNSINENGVHPESNYREIQAIFGNMKGVFKLGLDKKAIFDFTDIIDVENNIFERYQYTGRKL